jgi:hypothetical protein
MAQDGSSAASGCNDVATESASAPLIDFDEDVSVVADLNRRPHHDAAARRRRAEADDDEAAEACIASSLSGTSTIIFWADSSSCASGKELEQSDGEHMPVSRDAREWPVTIARQNMHVSRRSSRQAIGNAAEYLG